MAAPKRPSLAVEKRSERGSRAARRLRREGYVPGVVYGGGDGDCTAFKVGWRDLRSALVAGSAVQPSSAYGATSWSHPKG